MDPLEDMANILERDFEAINRLRDHIQVGIAKTFDNVTVGTGGKLLPLGRPLADAAPFRAGLLELSQFASGAQQELVRLLRQLGREVHIPD